MEMEIIQEYLGLSLVALIAIVGFTISVSKGISDNFNIELARYKFILSSLAYLFFFATIAIIDNPSLKGPIDYAKLVLAFGVGFFSATGVYGFIKPKAPVEVITYKK